MLNEEKKSGPGGAAQWILVILLIIASFFIGSLITKIKYLEKSGQPTPITDGAQPTVAPIDLETIKSIFSKNVIKFGDTNRKVLFVEVADPSCPFCAIAAGQNSELNKQVDSRFTLVKDGGTYVAPVPAMRKLVEEGVASFAYIYFPGHGNGEMGTKAIYCAFEAGKYWEVHDKLMTQEGYTLLNDKIKNDKSKSADLAQFLKSQMDPRAMKTCLDKSEGDTHLSEDISLARSLGVSGTPGFFVNENRFPGAYNYTEMETTVNKILGK